MSPGISEFVDATWRLFILYRLAAETLGFVSVFIGAILYFGGKRNSGRHLRGRGLLVGGFLALLTVIFVKYIYRAIVWITTRTTGSISPETAMIIPPLRSQVNTTTTIGVSSMYPMIAGISQGGAVLGMTAIVAGAGFWGTGKMGSLIRHRGKRMVYLGIALLFASLGAELIIWITYVLAPIWV